MSKFLCLTADNVSGAAGSIQSASGGADFTAVFLIISLIVAVALPVTLLLYGKIKAKGSCVMTVYGILGYILFYVILSSLLASIILSGYSDQNATYFEATIYIVLQIVCLELGRFLFLKLGKKKHNQWGDALLLSAGYCVMEAFVIAVFFIVPYLVIVLSPDAGQIDGIWKELRVYVVGSNLVSGKEWRFIVKAFTILVFFAMQVSSTLLMHISVVKKEKWMMILPLAVDALILIPNRLSSFDVWYLGKNYVIIPYLAVISIAVIVFTFVMYKRIYNRVEEQVDTSYIDKLAAK